jgi:glycosyltransferase involved in cell wall biosynthesis
MIIGIDICSIPYGTGVSNYTLNLVRHLVRLDKKNFYKLFFCSFRQPLPIEISKLASLPNVKIYHYRLPPTLFEILWNRLHIIPVELFIGKCDIFHTWDWTQPPTIKAKTITTVHDFVPFLFPDKQHKRTIQAFKQKLYWASRECSHFICVSQNTQKDLLRLFPKINPQKISVIYEAPEDKYLRFAKLSSPSRAKKLSVISSQYGLDKYVLAVGTREPRKNLDRLISAFTAYKKNNPGSKVELAISGKYGWGQDISSLNKSIKILGYIPDKDIVALYAKAICLAYPSLYEGFGLPILNAMVVGTPVITSDVSSMPEVAGKSAVYIDPLDIKNMTQTIEKVVKNTTLRHRLSKYGLSQSSKFSWTKAAQETLRVYDAIFNL